MQEFWDLIQLDKLKPFLAPLATCLAITVSTCLWILAQKRKDLAYEVMTSHSLMEVSGNARHLLDVCFNGHHVKDVAVVLVRIVNSGHLPILPGDYQSRLTISPGVGTKVLYAEVTDTEPVALLDELETNSLIEKIDETRVTLRPLLLNQGNTVTVQLILSNPAQRITVGGHIQGIRDIGLRRGASPWPTIMINVGALIMAISMLLFDGTRLQSLEFIHLMPFAFAFLTGYIIVWSGLSLQPAKNKAS